MNKRHQLGKLGEELAKKYLESRGYIIIDSNFRANLGEIDIIARISRNNKIVFFEVKTRSTPVFGLPEESLTPRKQLRLAKTINIYLLQNPRWENIDYQVDLITVYALRGGKKAKITHWQNVLEEDSVEQALGEEW